jgi:hypothetical protein
VRALTLVQLRALSLGSEVTFACSAKGLEVAYGNPIQGPKGPGLAPKVGTPLLGFT